MAQYYMISEEALDLTLGRKTVRGRCIGYPAKLGANPAIYRLQGHGHHAIASYIRYGTLTKKMIDRIRDT